MNSLFPAGNRLMTKTIGIVFLLLFLVAGGYFFLQRNPLQHAPLPGSLVGPHGLAAVKEYKSDTGESLLPQTYKNPFIDGIVLRVDWNDLEPTQSVFKWEIIDAVFSQVHANGKWVGLIIVPGFGTPDWAIAGTATGVFDKKYGRGKGEQAVLPLPWDKKYLDRWVTFLTKLSERYSNDPAFVLIAATGPTSVSGEMSLPNDPADLLTWKRLGYRPSLYIDAWKTTFAKFSSLFPKQYVSLALYPGLPINENGERNSEMRADTRLRIIERAKQSLVHFAIQTSGLHAGGDAAGFDLVKEYGARGALPGFQMSTSATRNPEKMGDATDPAHALKLSIDNGLSAGAKYLEIYEPDILNPDMQTVLKEAKARF